MVKELTTHRALKNDTSGLGMWTLQELNNKDINQTTPTKKNRSHIERKTTEIPAAKNTTKYCTSNLYNYIIKQILDL